MTLVVEVKMFMICIQLKHNQMTIYNVDGRISFGSIILFASGIFLIIFYLFGTL